MVTTLFFDTVPKYYVYKEKNYNRPACNHNSVVSELFSNRHVLLLTRDAY
jgi:hypothetical protein